jgi:hypothetical protein
MSEALTVNKGGRRKGFKMPEEHRHKLKVSNLLSRLQKCALGEITLPPDQLKALEICLRKVLPDLSQTEVKADIKTYVARLPEPAPDAAAWLESVEKPLLVTSALPMDTQPIDNASVSSVNKAQTDDYTPGD